MNIPDEIVPSNVRATMELEVEKEKIALEERVAEFNKVQLRVFYKRREKNININKDSLVSEVKKTVFEKFNI